MNLLVAAAAVEAEATAERDADQTDLFNSSCESADEGATTTYPRARVSTKAAGGSLLSWRENKACRFYGLVWYGIITHRGRLFNERVIGKCSSLARRKLRRAELGVESTHQPGILCACRHPVGLVALASCLLPVLTCWRGASGLLSRRPIDFSRRVFFWASVP